MSHKGTLWAIQQRGLMPATKLVLWHLCDRHTPDFGCYPAQDQLAFDAEISRASLNAHLRKLEEAGLIRRHRRADQETNRRKSTRYILGFEDDFPPNPCPDSRHGNDQNPCPNPRQNLQEPCPDLEQNPPKPCPNLEQSHVQILDMNLVRKKETTTARDAHARETPNTDPEAACLAACGEGLCPASRSAVAGTSAVITNWLAAGYDLATDILPTLADRTTRRRASPIRTWDYFTAAIIERHARRVGRAAGGRHAGEAGSGRTNSAGTEPGRLASTTGQPARPAPTDTATMIAGWIADGRYVPPSAVSTSMRHELLRRGLVTEEALRALQIY